MTVKGFRLSWTCCKSPAESLGVDLANQQTGISVMSDTIGFEPFLNTDFVTWIVTFYQLMLVVTGVMHEADNVYSIRRTWLC